MVKKEAEAFLIVPLSQILLIQVLHCPFHYTAKAMLFITQHHDIQDFATGYTSLTQKLTFVYAEVCAVSSTRHLGINC